jgi:hypothetical protein
MFKQKWDEARQLLAAVYGWCAEGFETADLREALTLLEESGYPRETAEGGLDAHKSWRDNLVVSAAQPTPRA